MLDKLRWILLPLVILIIPLTGYLTWDSLRSTPERARERFLAMRGSFWGGTVANIDCREMNAGSALRALEKTPEAAKIRWIRFGGRYLSTADIAVLGNFPQLIGLEFPHSHFSTEDFIALSKSTSLQTLNLESLWRASQFAPVVEQFTTLNTLGLDECEIDDDSAQRLAKHKALTVLSINRSQLSSSALELLLASENLKALSLFQAKITESRSSGLTTQSRITTLYWICGADDFGEYGQLLCSAKNFPDITSLTLSCKTESVVECVMQLKAHRNLGSLTIIVESLPPPETLNEIKSLADDVSIQIRDRKDHEWGNSAGYSQPNSVGDGDAE
jgi:hypothetical protein